MVGVGFGWRRPPPGSVVLADRTRSGSKPGPGADRNSLTGLGPGECEHGVNSGVRMGR